MTAPSATAAMPARDPVRVGIVSVHYDPRHLSRSAAAACRLARESGAVAHVAVANDASIESGLRQAVAELSAARSDCVVHDNSGLEFGAYQAGLGRLLPLDAFDWVVFVNDTFGRHRAFPSVHRRHLLAALARPSVAGVPMAAGEVETHGRSWSILGKRSHRWLTTAVFALDRAALRALGDRVHVPEVDALVRATADPATFFAADLDPAIADLIRGWILAPRSSETWYGAAPLDAANAARMAGKARAILQEKYLSAALDEAGTWFFDIKGAGTRDRVLRRLEAIGFALATRFRS